METDLFSRISALETRFCYGLPPQNEVGGYSSLVREHLDQAVNVNHFPEILGQELQVLERKGILQDRLQNLLLGERNIDRILELSPYSDIRREAYSFIEDRLSHLGDLRYPYQRHLMEGSLHYFITQLPSDSLKEWMRSMKSIIG